MSTIIEHTMTPQQITSGRKSPRLLLIAYNFPPVGGAGVQRPVKWVKNLRRQGWDVTVLTTENPSVPTRDESLLADIPEDVLVLRARTWEPDYQTKRGLVETVQPKSPSLLSRVKANIKSCAKQLVKFTLQPDPQVLWVPNAIQAGRRVLRELSHDAILVTAPAYSSFFVGTALKRQSGLPLILDFRDEWDMSGKYLENAQRDRVSHFIQNCMQKHVLKRADAVVATTMASTAALAEKLAGLKRAKTPTVTIYNGFDEEDFQPEGPHSQPLKPVTINPIAATTTSVTNESILPGLGGLTAEIANRQKTFRLLYTGTLWNLTTIEPLVSAVLQLQSAAPELVSQLELVCVGRKTPEQMAILERLRSTGCRLELIDYCEHSKVLEWLRSTDAVCLLLSDVVGAERVVPAKLFEYLANKKDMLAIVPRGETADIVQQFFPQGHLEPKDVDGIARWLQQRLSGTAGKSTEITDNADIEIYSRATQTKRLVALLNQLVQQHNPRGNEVTR